MSINFQDRVTGGILGLVVGDALGVPVEFRSRDAIAKDPVVDMRSFGTHNQPKGTWSDDSSLALATLDSLLDGYDTQDMLQRFYRWYSEAYMTPHDEVFDIGNTTRKALLALAEGTPKDLCGQRGEDSNGNGSLMRILPLSLFLAGEPIGVITTKSCEVSALTHAHVRSQLCCAFYSQVVGAIMASADFTRAIRLASKLIAPKIPDDEKETFAPLLSGKIFDWPEEKINGSGYVVDCLYASLWCCNKYRNYRDAVLAAVNLGDDTDTTGAVTGGLCGVLYGEEGIPKEWISSLVKHNQVVGLAECFATKLSL